MKVSLPLVAGFIIYDGFRGPPIGAMNLRRAALDSLARTDGLGTLVAGNVSAWPAVHGATNVRKALASSGRSWPSWLLNKWLAVFLLVGFLWAYEAFALWDSPWWTAGSPWPTSRLPS